MLSSFYRACVNDGVGVQLNRVHNPVEAASNSRYGLTDNQERTLTAAFESGYFEIPRGTTIRELADGLGVSDSAVPQRLRRAQSSLVAATVMTATERSPFESSGVKRAARLGLINAITVEAEHERVWVS